MEDALAKRWLHESDIESVSPLVDLAHAEEMLQETSSALNHYVKAEATARRAIVSLPDMGRPYRYTLQVVLIQHANLLTKLNRRDEATRLTLEAGALNELAPP